MLHSLSIRGWRRSIELDLTLSQASQLPQLIVDKAADLFTNIASQTSELWPPLPTDPIIIPPKPHKRFYNKFASSFTRDYFHKNLYKCLLASEILRYHSLPAGTVYDIGSGSGSFSIAMSMSVHNERIVLVERSPQQLKIAKLLVKCFSLYTEFDFQRQNILSFDARNKDCIASYSLSECVLFGIDILSLIDKSNSFFIIDSPAFVRALKSLLDYHSFTTFSGYVEFKVDHDELNLIEGGGGRFSYLYKIGRRGERPYIYS